MIEGRKFCRLCKNLGIDCETGTFYCSLSHRPDKLPNTLKCDEFVLCDFIKRLEQENKELKEFCIELEKQKEKQQNQWFERCTENHNEDSKIIENYRSALEEIKDLCIHYENTNDKCVTNCYAHFIVTALIQDKINEVLE